MIQKIREFLPFDALQKLGLILVVTGLFFSKVFISVGSMILFGVWLLDKDLFPRIRIFLRNKAAVILFLIFVLHVVGLFYSENVDFGARDVRIKLPLAFMPLIFSSGISISKKQWAQLRTLYLGSLIVLMVACTIYWLMNKENIHDKRDMSLFISHIRFGLFASFGFFLSLHQFIQKRSDIYFGCAVLILCYMIFAQLMTGIFITAAILPFVFIYELHRVGARTLRNTLVILFSALALVIAGYFIYAFQAFNEAQTPKSVPHKTHSAQGSVYFPKPHQEQPKLRENGFLVYHQIAYNELKESWNKTSSIQYDSLTTNQTPVNIILIRYLSSKGLTKDKEGVGSLSKEDIHAIEMGVPNVRYVGQPGIFVRFQEIFWEIHNYINGGNSNGHSVVMRLEYLLTGLQIWNQHLIFGVGNGDLQDAFDEQYELNHSELEQQWRLRTHNQYVSIAASLGLIGLSLFLLSLIYPLFSQSLSFEYYVFLGIVMLSMLTDDTLETQAGVSFYAFFNALYLFGIKRD